MSRAPKRKRSAAGRRMTKEKRLAAALSGLLVLALALALSLSGGFDRLSELLGILPNVPVPQLANGEDAGPVSVHFIDVGQGDAALIEDNGEYALIDAGPPECTDTLLGYLRAAGVTRLRYVFMTHPHADHIGAMQAVLENLQVDTLVLPEFDKAPAPTTSLFLGVLQAAADKAIASEAAATGAEYPLGQGAIHVLQNGVTTEENLNLLSLVLLYQSGDFRFLDTGDAESINERALLETGQDISATLFVAAHHGSSTSNTPAFLAAVHPQMVVVSCAKNNSYGHPHREPMETFKTLGATALTTAEYGSIRVWPDGDGGLLYATAPSESAATAPLPPATTLPDEAA